MLVGGLAGSTAGTILACRSTLKLEPVLDRAKADIDRIHAENAENAKKELTKVYLRPAKDVGKLYAAPTALICLSDALLVLGHVVMRKENAALAAAYIALSESFNKYRKRVEELHGKDADVELMYGLKEAEKQAEDEPTSYIVNGNNLSVYARIFDEFNPNWSKKADANLFFLKQVQCWANDRLKSRGYLFLNEVYEALSIPMSEAGQYVGWVMDQGDSYVDFGLFDVTDPLKRDFVNGHERGVILDFNVDGPIMYIFKHPEE